MSAFIGDQAHDLSVVPVPIPMFKKFLSWNYPSRTIVVIYVPTIDGTSPFPAYPFPSKNACCDRRKRPGLRRKPCLPRKTRPARYEAEEVPASLFNAKPVGIPISQRSAPFQDTGFIRGVIGTGELEHLRGRGDRHDG
jgi:hypothetical protein